MSEQKSGAKALGRLITLALIAALIGLGVYVINRKDDAPAASAPAASAAASAGAGAAPATAGDLAAIEAEIVETKTEMEKFPPPVAYKPKDKTLDVELSEYAGYAGLIVANGGLAPSASSVLFKKHGVKLNIKLSEEEGWARFNNGALAASATTVDVLAAHSGQLSAVVPAQIGFSRGADGIVVRSGIKRINDLKGRILVTSQLNEADFLVRFLAQEAGIEVKALTDLKQPPDPDKINLIFTADAKQAGVAFQKDLQRGGELLAGCVTWAPFTDEVVAGSGGKARILITNTNLLIVGDILIVNKGLAEQEPEMVAALVDGLLEGNRMVRDHGADHVDVIAKAFGWERGDVMKELAKVHLANLPESLAFFSGTIDAAGSFSGIYQSAILAYGTDFIKDPIAAEKYLDLSHLKALEASGAYKDQKVAIEPIRTKTDRALEVDPILSKDIRFFFEPNSAKLDMTGADTKENEQNLAAIKKLLQVSPGSTVLLRGHVDDALVPKFREQGGDALVRKMALTAMQLSKDRAEEVRRLVMEKHRVGEKRLDVYGAGWNEPVSREDPDKNRRVEVRWFTVE